MDLLQVVNGFAALAAFAAAVYAFVRFHDGRSHVAQIVHVANGTILLWFAAVNLSAGFGVWGADRDLVPLLRWGFAPLLGTYTARQLLAGRRQRRGEML